jgi:GT2 family glycosyltransferase
MPDPTAPPSQSPADPGLIGVIIVAYQSGDVIGACVESLLASQGAGLRVVVCDNASTDETVAKLRRVTQAAGVALAEHPAAWAGALSFDELAPVTLLRSDANLGYAGAVNIGLRALAPHLEVGLFWVLNPDSVVLPDTAAAYLRAAGQGGAFGLMGGRTVYHEAPNRIQSDGGRVSRWTGVARNLNAGCLPEEVEMPDPTTLDFISGANMVASRAFVDQVGSMAEDYFLYYEELDWAARRGDLPFRLCAQAVVLHHGGTTIGSGSETRRSSGFANYFNYRNRMRFMRRFNPAGLPLSYAYSMAKIATLAARGARDEAAGAFRGLHHLPPPAAVRARLSPEAAARAFGRA